MNVRSIRRIKISGGTEIILQAVCVWGETHGRAFVSEVADSFLRADD